MTNTWTTHPCSAEGTAAFGDTDQRKRYGNSTARELTARQQKILDAIRTEIEQKGYPPSMRQIGDMVGLASLSSVTHQLGRLENMGYIRRDPKLPRAIEVLDENGVGMHTPRLNFRTFEVGEDDLVPVPLVGRIAAGGPITAEQFWKMYSPCRASWSAAASLYAPRSGAIP